MKSHRRFRSDPSSRIDEEDNGVEGNQDHK